jgi:hypothetical protein
MGKICMNCRYERSSTDSAVSEAKCPSCGAYYVKSAANFRKKYLKKPVKPVKPKRDFTGLFIGIIIFIGFFLLVHFKTREVDEPTNPLYAQFSSFDGSHRKVERFVKAMLKDPGSYQHVDTRFIDMKDYLLVTTTYRATNSFNAVMTETHTFKTNLAGDVLEMIQ